MGRKAWIHAFLQPHLREKKFISKEPEKAYIFMLYSNLCETFHKRFFHKQHTLIDVYQWKGYNEVNHFVAKNL